MSRKEHFADSSDLHLGYCRAYWAHTVAMDDRDALQTYGVQVWVSLRKHAAVNYGK